MEVNSKSFEEDYGITRRYRLNIDLMQQKLNIGRFYLPESMNVGDLNKLKNFVNITNVTRLNYDKYLNRRATNQNERKKTKEILKSSRQNSGLWKDDMLKNLLPCDVRFLLKVRLKFIV